MDLVILAGGTNSRMCEYSWLPKILFPVEKNSTILLSTYHKAKDHFRSIYVIINDRYFDKVNEYVSLLKLNIRVIASKNISGSFDTLKEISAELKESSDGYLFLWSDLILESLSEFTESNKGPIIFSQKGSYRTAISLDKTIYEVSDFSGNIPGIYYLPNLCIFLENYRNIDLVFAIRDFYKKHEIESREISCKISEYKDKDSFELLWTSENIKDVSSVGRHFNSLEFEKDRVIKTSDNLELLYREYQWHLMYNPYLEVRFESLNSFSMKKIEGETMFQRFSKANNIEKRLLINAIVDSVDKLHSKANLFVDTFDFLKSMNLEFNDKTMKRILAVKNLLNLQKDDFAAIDKIEIIWKTVREYYKKLDAVECRSIHGDLNFSNMMIDKLGRIVFIDPRGYFGDIEMFGPVEYDYAKILYALSGYDYFNASKGFKFESSKKYDSPVQLVSDDLIEFYLDKIKEKCNTDIVKAFLPIIWLSLSSYIGSDPHKANIAFNHGKALLELWNPK